MCITNTNQLLFTTETFGVFVTFKRQIHISGGGFLSLAGTCACSGHKAKAVFLMVVPQIGQCVSFLSCVLWWTAFDTVLIFCCLDGKSKLCSGTDVLLDHLLVFNMTYFSVNTFSRGTKRVLVQTAVLSSSAVKTEKKITRLWTNKNKELRQSQ
jgi:hypothetical protein